MVSVKMTIGAEVYNVTVNVDSALRMSDSGTISGSFGWAPRTFTLSQLLALFGEAANVAKLELASPHIVSRADPNKILGTITQHPITGDFTLTPSATGENGVVTFVVSGLPTQGAAPAAATTSKAVTIGLTQVMAPTASLTVSSAQAIVGSADPRATVTTYSCVDAEGKNCTPTLSGADMDLFAVFESTVIAKSALPKGTYQLALNSGDKTAALSVVSQDAVPVPTDTVAPSQTSSTNLGEIQLGSGPLIQTLTFDEAVTSAAISGLPAGVTAVSTVSGKNVLAQLTVDPKTFVFQSAVQPVSFTVRVQDAVGNSRQVTQTATVRDVAPIPDGAFASLADMTVSDYAGNFPITINAGGVTDSQGRIIVYSATGLPAGLSINSSTGVISGSYDSNAGGGLSEKFPVTVKAQATGSNQSASKQFFLSIRDDG